MAVIEFRTLGTLDLRRTDGSELHSLLAQPKRIALLAYLCLAKPRGFHRRDTLLGLFWPEADQTHARTSLRNALHVLRHSLGETALHSRGDEEIAVNLDAVWCDAVAFEDQTASEEIDGALELYRGDLLSGFFLDDVPAFEHWLEGERTGLRATAARMARVAAERLELERNITGAISLARRAVELTDTDERAVRRLVELLARIGDRAGALQAYENLASHLASEFEAEPSAETRALVDRLRNSQSAPTHLQPGAPDGPHEVQSFPYSVTGYSIERELGRGGTSTVFLARDLKHDRPVAIKILRPEVASALGTDRFLAEIALAARLHHPHILPLLDSGKANGLPYYAMPHVEGQTLRSRLRSERFLPLDDAILIACEVADALGYAHAHGIIHRDIKPENILLENGHALVTDFGIAHAISEAGGERLTETGVAVGTAAYMSPEQVDSAVKVDARADIYALACVLYEMLTGDPPFSGSTAQAVLARKATEPAPPMRAVRDTISPDLERNVLKALSRAPADRFHTVKEFADALRSRNSTGRTALSASAGRLPISRNRRTVRIATSIAAVIVAVIVIIAVAKRDSLPVSLSPVEGRQLAVSASGIVAASSPAANGPINTVAVIPFANTGGNPKDEYFSDGMTDELAYALSRLPQLRVAGRSSSYAFKGKSLSAQEIGKALGVSAVVEGSVSRSGQRLRVIAQLTSAKNGQVMWSDTFKSRASDFLQVQDDFTKAIVGALAPALGVKIAAGAASTSRGTDDQAAYDLYLRGRYFFARRGAAGLRRAIAYFTEAAAKDPKFARARAGMGMAYGVLGFFDTSDSTGGKATIPELYWLPLALKNAEIAVALDSSLGDAHLALANALTNSTRLKDADVEYQRALRLQPEDPTTHEWYGANLSDLGRVDEGLAEERRAAALDPLSPVIAVEVAMALFAGKQFREAIMWNRRALELDSTLTLAEQFLGNNYVFAGQAQKGVQVLERAYARDPGQPGARGSLIFAYAASGRWTDVRRLYRDLTAKSRQVADADLLLAYLVVGNRQRALDVFEHWTAHGNGDLALGCDPGLDPLHNEPRFLAVIHRFGVRICPVTTPWPIKPPPADFSP